MAMDSPQCIEILKASSSSEFQKAKACMRLAVIGTKDAVPALAALLGDQHLSHYARFGLVPIPDPSVDDALRGALKTTKGELLAGVVDSIGQRKDAEAVPALTKMIYGIDIELARAAAASLGRIGGKGAVAALQTGLVKTKGPVRNAVAAACLVCADEMMARGDRKAALDLLATLTRPDIPKSVRLAAMHSTIEAERSISRPRVVPPLRNQ
jgi:HEAT repeat protein